MLNVTANTLLQNLPFQPQENLRGEVLKETIQASGNLEKTMGDWLSRIWELYHHEQEFGADLTDTIDALTDLEEACAAMRQSLTGESEGELPLIQPSLSGLPSQKKLEMARLLCQFQDLCLMAIGIFRGKIQAREGFGFHSFQERDHELKSSFERLLSHCPSRIQGKVQSAQQEFHRLLNVKFYQEGWGDICYE